MACSARIKARLANAGIQRSDFQDSGESAMGEIRVSDKLKELARGLCSRQTLRKKLPIIQWLPKYGLKELQCDMIAGLTVGLTVIPQGLAYAKIAGLPPVYGLYSSFMGCFVYCLLGTSKDITLGPTAIMSLMTGTFALSPIQEDPTFALVLTLMCGIIQLVMGVLNLGIIVNFISYPVINAFTSAAAVTIAFGQVKSILGLTNIPRDFPSEVYWTFAKIGQTKVWDLTLGLCCIVILFLLKRLRSIKWNDLPLDPPLTLGQRVSRKFLWLIGTGANAVVVVAAAGVAASLDSVNISAFSLTGEIREGLPPFEPPAFSVSNGNVTFSAGDILKHLGTGLGIVPLLGLVETIAIGKAFARQNDYRIDPSQELVAIGCANIISSFVSSYPVTGSFSRTAVNSQSGVCTPANGIFTGALILVALALLTPWFYYIPKAALAAVIIAAVLQMVDYKIVLTLWKVNKIDLLTLIITFLASLVVGIEYGILIGIGFSIVIMLYPVARPKLRSSPRAGVLTVQPNQGLLFPAAEYVEEKLTEMALSGAQRQNVLFDMRNISGIDYTTVLAIFQMIAVLKKYGLKIAFVHIQGSVLSDLLRADLPGLLTFATAEEALEELSVQVHAEDLTQSLDHQQGDTERQPLLK